VSADARPGRFQGVIGRDWRESTPWWPEPVRAPEGAPSVVLVVLDDVGYAQLGCYGSDIETPTIDRLAASGLRFTRFHTTALCSPTRACLLTGRNHHSVGMGRITQFAMGYPGYHGMIPKSCGFVSEILAHQGWAAYAVGKWHLTPETETGAGSPRGRWPLGRGFERYYGFLGGATDQYAPELVEGNEIIDPPGRYEDGYHLTTDLVDHAIRYVADLESSAPGRPFFLYLATGAGHAPHQVHPEWIERYRGRFDKGWDRWREETFERQRELGVVPEGAELSPRPPWVDAWEDLPAEHRRLFARYMECFAGFMSHTDAELGRLVSFLERIGRLDNTILVVLSDNGASAEGGPRGSLNELRDWNGVGHDVGAALRAIDELGGPRFHNNYPWGWTMAGNTPFRRWKREVHEGGIADPLILSWPAGLGGRAAASEPGGPAGAGTPGAALGGPDTPGAGPAPAGGVRHQFVHAIDVVPTLLELAGVEAPEELDGVPQEPIEGTSFAYLLEDRDAPERHRTQYFEMFGSRAIYHEGWKAVTYKPLAVWLGGDPDRPFDEDVWELYHLDSDFSECHDLAAERPDKLRELVERWWIEAARYHVLPLDNRPMAAYTAPKPQVYRPRARHVYYPGTSRVPDAVAVDVRNRSHVVAALVEVPPGGAEGVLVALGSAQGGFSLFVSGGRLHYVHNLAGAERHRIDGTEPIGEGRHLLGFEFERTGEHRGTGRLYVDERLVGEGEIPRFTPIAFGGGLHVGRDPLSPVAEDYEAPFAFTGVLHEVVVDVSGRPHRDLAAEVGLALSLQ
jgi:arylsulfatase A-like enzyme